MGVIITECLPVSQSSSRHFRSTLLSAFKNDTLFVHLLSHHDFSGGHQKRKLSTLGLQLRLFQ